MERDKEVTIRELMPRNYTIILAKKTKRSKQYANQVVLNEVTTSPIWDEVIKLAEETKAKRLEEQNRLDALKAVA
ncbi:hypothetical protein [Rufibacter soli]